jgi:hypothetical protein
MNSEQFVYWLKGFMELQNPEIMDKEQIQKIKDKLEDVVDVEITKQTNYPISDPNTFPMWQEPHTKPLTPNPYRIDCGDNIDKNAINDLQSGVKKK